MKLVFNYIILLLFMGCAEDNDSANTTETVTKYPIVEINTRLGKMHFWLFDETPNHKQKFIELANDHHYDQFSFNRVVNDFVIQGGCPDSPSYFDGSPYLLEPEFVDSIGHIYGALGMGRDDNPEKKSNACQFYIVSKEAGLPNLDGNYMIFGAIINGADVLEAIEKEDTDNTDTPLTPIPLEVKVLELSALQIEDMFNYTVEK